MDSFTTWAVIPASAADIYNAWLSSKEHSAMTEGEAKCSAKVGGKFTAWDGYISGTNLELAPDEKVVQAWRTTEFADSDADSRLEVALTPAKNGTRVTLRHSGLPAGSGPSYRDGWRDFYFAPMKRYFAARR
jgi:activator of HSP90 ATPase